MSTPSARSLIIGLVVCTLGFTGFIQAAQLRNSEGASKTQQLVDVRLRLSQHIQNEFQVRKELQSCNAVLAVTPDNHEALLKAAYLHFRLGWLYSGKKEKKEHYLKFFDLATRAYKINPSDYYTLLLMAVAKAKVVSYLSQGDQVRIARELVQDINGLMDQKGENPELLYLLSWLNFEVGQIPAFKKFLAGILFGGLPEGLSTENAFCLMKKAIQSRPRYIPYRYDLGRYYAKIGNPQEAHIQFEKILSMSPQSAEGLIYQKWAGDKIRE